jgi:hypothetical protein
VALCPTPCAADSGRASGTFARGNLTLTGAAKTWPTPTAHDGSKGGPNQAHSDGTLMLTSAAVKATREIWPTPTAGDSKASGGRNATAARADARTHTGTSLTDAAVFDGGTSSRRAREGSADGMVLNPRFVSAMMGVPEDWTEL